MPEYTQHLGLYKPNINDAIGIASSLSDNFMRIDNKLGNALKNKNNVTYATLGERLDAELTTLETVQSDVTDLKHRQANLFSFDGYLRMIAHRGNMHAAPENTLSAIRKAIDAGYWAVEFDVQLTSDGVWVLMHDSTIDRTSNGTGTLRSMTFAQLRTYDYGSKWGSYTWAGQTVTPYAGEPIPTLEEALKLCRIGHVVPMIEIKKGGGAEYTDVEIESLVNLIKKWNMVEKCAVLAFDLVHLQKLRVYSTDIVVGYLSSSLTQSVIDNAKNLKNAFLNINKAALLDPANADLIQQIRNEKIPLAAYTVNNSTEVRKLVDLGVKAITTDYIPMGRGL